LLLADTYMAKGEDADADVILQSIIESNPKQEFLDEARKKQMELKVKQGLDAGAERAKEEEKNKEMKVQFNQTQNDQNLFKEEGENPAPAQTTTVNPQQPK
jgi:hypothetical protein